MPAIEPPSSQACPLCATTALQYARPASGCYFRCPECDLVSQWQAELPGEAAEREFYGTHENSPADAGYRKFLGRLAEPLFERLVAGAEGLDFGCGPGPTLSVMAAEAGFRMHDYDPLFAADSSLLQRRYDFLTCTEAAEHFHDPAREFALMQRLLKPGGLLGLMTELHDAHGEFDSWWYHRDPTHVCFYSERTLAWLAREFGWELIHRHRAVTLFRVAGG